MHMPGALPHEVALTNFKTLSAMGYAGDVAALPFADGSFDMTVDTFGLCVFPNPQQAMQELARVTKPAGSVLLLEHARSRNPALGLYQDLTAGPVAAMGKGCVWNQDVQMMVSAAGLQIQQVDYALAGTICTIIARKRS